MIRTLIFMALMTMSMLVTSCCFSQCFKPLTQVFRETMKMVKSEVRRSIKLTSEKMKYNEVEFHAGNAIIDNLTETLKQIDTLMAASVQLDETGTKETIFLFAERTNQVIMSTLTNLESLRDLYDISTCSQFESYTFFSADSIGITPEKMDDAKKAIEPVAQRIVRFIGDHPRQKFEVVIACSSTLAGQELNVKLYELRARSVANLLADQIRSKEEFIPHPEWVHFDIKWMDKEEALPYRSRRKHIKLKDKRSRIVSLTWNMLPASLFAGSSY